jgi:hypothetical protein
MESYDVDALLIVHHNDELGTVFKGEHLDLATSLFCLARENEDFANMFRLANKALKNDGTESVRQ